MKRKFFKMMGALAIALALVFGFALLGCKTDDDPDGGGKKYTVTVTIKNTSSSDLIGIAVETSNNTYVIGSEGTLDTSRKIAAGSQLTLPAFDVPAWYGDNGSHMFRIYIKRGGVLRGFDIYVTANATYTLVWDGSTSLRIED